LIQREKYIYMRVSQAIKFPVNPPTCSYHYAVELDKPTPSPQHPKLRHPRTLRTFAHWRIDKFYFMIHIQLLYGSRRSRGSLAAEIEERLCGCAPQDVSGILQEALIAGSVMDSGWLDDYNDIAEAVSVYTQGYPKEYLAQRRALNDAAAGREISKHSRKQESPHRFSIEIL
jgi:hypothetical protein